MLMSLHKSMLASYNLYNKTRPSASKSSVARAKQLLEECGGAAQLQSMLHPSFSTEESAKQHGHQPGLEDMSCFHMSPLMFLHIFTGCLMGWYHFISSRSDPLMIQPFFFFSGVDIGDEHLIPGYVWMFSISFNIQWSVRWFVEETIAGLVKIIMTSFGNDRHVPMNFAGERGLPWFLVKTWACTASRICDHLQFGYVLHPNSARFSTQDREARERLVRECYAHHGASQVGCCCGLCHSVARGN